MDAIDELITKVWYNRHQVRRDMVESGKTKLVEKETFPIKDHRTRPIQREIWEGALKAAAKVEKRFGLENLGPWDDFEWGMLNGKLSALRFRFPREARHSMEQTLEPRRRLNVLTKAERRQRIFARLREGWAYDEIAREERVSAERIRQIVSEVLGKRVIDRGADHAHLQLERLMPALRVAGEAIGRGELKAVAPLIKVIDRLDKHQDTVVAKYSYGPEERQRLLDKINRLADNLQPLEPVAPAADDHENNAAEIPA